MRRTGAAYYIGFPRPGEKKAPGRGGREKFMKKHRSTIILIAVFFVGLSVLLYPTVSNYVNSFHQSRAIATYEENLASFTEEDYTASFRAAQAYNDALLNGEASFHSGAPLDGAYASLLSVTDDGEMGYVTIQKLGVQLPVYHGTAETILAVGTGHLEGSSLPVGGVGTHAVITGHRGLPSAKLFTSLDKLDIGDTFTVTVLNQTLTYEVDKISIVLPDDVSLLQIDPNEDYVTLLTCTPYAVNTHRLLVRGVRTDAAVEVRVAADAVQIDPVLVAPVVAAPMLLLLLLLLLTGRPGKRGNRKGVNAGEDGETA